MKKQELAAALAERLHTSRAQAVQILDALFAGDGIIAGELKHGRAVRIAGFGSFELRTRAARQGRNPRTGKSIKIEPSTTAAFRPGQALKARLNPRRR